MKKSVLVKSVLKGSAAEEAGIEQGDCILSINGEEINDVFDYRFLSANEFLLLELEKSNGEIWEIEIEKGEYEDLGMEFDSPMMDEPKRCGNRCIFCFIDQLPKGLRDTLYFKDDDARLSFLTGNYVTLTNMSMGDIKRIIKYRMSPVNISVHATNPEVRALMLSNKKAGDIISRIKMLADGGIKVNCQIVLCRDINDGSELDRSIYELASFYPGVNSVSVVPVGITRFRDHLHYLKPYDKKSSAEVIEQVEGWQKRLLERFGSRIVFMADEFYIMAGRDLPGYDEYEDFPQIENGVGLMASLMQEFSESIGRTAWNPDYPELRRISIATGVSAYKHICEMTRAIEEKYGNISINVYEIKNEFFGENVTVAGLLTGTDLHRQLSGKNLGEELLISQSMLKAGEELFLDDFTVNMLEDCLNVKITAVANTGRDFIEKALGKGDMIWQSL